MTSALRLIFAGTPAFAASSLQALLDAGHNIIAVYTQPDRPAGRGRKLHASPVKILAQAQQIPVYQPENFNGNSDIETLQQLDADLMVVTAYGLLLPPAVLTTPRLGCINVHASLLPRWRGAAPIQRAILAGDSETGITIMQMNEGLDTGDILLKQPCPIKNTDTGGSLHDRLAPLGGQALQQALEKLQQGTLSPQPQDNSLSTYARKLSKQEAMLDWQEDAAALARRVRAFNPWPVAQTRIGDQILRIWSAEPLDGKPGGAESSAEPGTVLACNKAGIDIATGDGRLRLKQLQPPGKKAMDTPAFLNGYANLLPVGACLRT
ncbi:Methionyl-tRNA formyltransferase [hydrothermal vent metagenome]|uniref:methionyl-tRNA formyltransferase n=1 Tax=hydrothermal vent metagenome TaxID=652676 RepID=A0A3B1BDY6_9ZZZZ